MNQINSITTKEKFKHLSNESIREIIREYNEFMTTVRVSFRSTHKNHHLKIPKRNINKTTFLKRLAVYHNTSLSNIYNIIRSSTTRIKDSLLNEKIIYDSQIAIIKRQNNKKSALLNQEDLNLNPRMLMEQFTITNASNSKGTNIFFWTPRAPHTSTFRGYTHMHTHINK